MAMRRMLILRGGALGDFILTLPVFEMIRHRWPKLQVEVAGYPRSASLAVMSGLAASMVSLDEAMMAGLFLDPSAEKSRALRDYLSRFDVALSYLHDPEGRVASALAEAAIPRRVCASPLVTSGHAIDHFLRPLEEFGLHPDGHESARLPLPGKIVRQGKDVLAPWGPRVVLLHPGSGSSTKNWPLDRFLDVAEHLYSRGIVALFILGEAEEGMDLPIIKRMGENHLLLKNIPLDTLAGIMAAGHLYVGNDSGISHLAAAVGVPSLVLFGPTDPSRWAPRGHHVTIVRGPKGLIEAVTKEEVLSALAVLAPRLFIM